MTLVLGGEVDVANREQLHFGLARLERADITLEAPAPADIQTVNVDMSELDFCDVYACRRILRFAAEVRAEGLQFRISGARTIIKRMATILDATDDLEFG
jgi:anti-anti-sigma regulatory factor